MKKLLIILAGFTATGKTFIAKSIKEQFCDSEIISIDDIEENFYDIYGFLNIQEKKELYNKSFEFFYKKLDKLMKTKKMIIIDYPFSYLQKDNLESIIKSNSYLPLTIRLVGDLQILYHRRIKRDLREDRHPGHLLPFYKKGMRVSLDKRKKYVISKYDFIKHAKLRKYDEFRIGDLLEIDVTNSFANLNIILDWISERYE